MSLLPPEVHSALSQLLRALSTPDNNVRSQAEEQLNNDWVQNRPDVLLMGLAEQIQGAEDSGVSQATLLPLLKICPPHRPSDSSKEWTINKSRNV